MDKLHYLMLSLLAISCLLIQDIRASEEEEETDGDEEFELEMNQCDPNCTDYNPRCPRITPENKDKRCERKWYKNRCPRSCGICIPCVYALAEALEAVNQEVYQVFEQLHNAVEQLEEENEALEDMVQEEVLALNNRVSDNADDIKELNHTQDCHSSEQCTYGSCVDNVCQCDSGYTGKYCGDNIDECYDGTHQCTGESAKCEDNIGSYTCFCDSDVHELQDDGLTCSIPNEYMVEDSQVADKLLEYLPEGKVIGDLCFKYTEENDMNTFRGPCHDYDETVTIFKSESNWIFGGYTDIKWEGLQSGFIVSKNCNSFIFILSPPEVAEKITLREGSTYCTKEIWDNLDLGPIFMCDIVPLNPWADPDWAYPYCDAHGAYNEPLVSQDSSDPRFINGAPMQYGSWSESQLEILEMEVYGIVGA